MSRVRDEDRYSVEYSPRKQQILSRLFEQVLVRNRLFARRLGSELVLYDLSGGPGWYPFRGRRDRRYMKAYGENKILSSPFVLLDVLRRFPRVKTTMTVFELDPVAFGRLSSRLARVRVPHVSIMPILGDGTSVLPGQMAKLKKAGLVYTDMGGTLYPFAAIHDFVNGAALIDGLMYFAAGDVKRQTSRGRGMRITDGINGLRKRNIFINVLEGDRHQWTFIYGTDQQVITTRLLELGFVPLKSPGGRRLHKLVTTSAEGKAL